MALRVNYQKTTGLFELEYGRLNYIIGLPEMGGITLEQLSNLDPETYPEQHNILLVCEAATLLRKAKTDTQRANPSPVNACSHKLFDRTNTKASKERLRLK